MNTTSLEIGKILRQARIKAKMTQLELSKILGYETSQFVSLVECGHSKAPYEYLASAIKHTNADRKKIFSILLKDFKNELETKLQGDR